MRGSRAKDQAARRWNDERGVGSVNDFFLGSRSFWPAPIRGKEIQDDCREFAMYKSSSCRIVTGLVNNPAAEHIPTIRTHDVHARARALHTASQQVKKPTFRLMGSKRLLSGPARHPPVAYRACEISAPSRPSHLFCAGEMYSTLLPRIKQSPSFALSSPFWYSSVCSIATFKYPSRQARIPRYSTPWFNLMMTALPSTLFKNSLGEEEELLELELIVGRRRIAASAEK